MRVILILLLILFPFGQRRGVVVERDIEFNELDNCLRVNLSFGKYPQAVKQEDGNYTVVAIPSPLVNLHTLTCAELYMFDNSELEDKLSLLALPKETNFIQVLTEPDGMILLIRLRTNCSET